MSDYFGKETPKLGFGLMRLPRIDGAIDIKETSKMVDLFLESGFTYFDTAYVYEGSEAAAKKALCTRHPRESYTLASKLNVSAAKDKASARREFEDSLSRSGAEYFDYYLLHALSAGNIAKYDEYDLWNYAFSLKERGLVKHVGFSFHDSPALLDKILTDHPEVEFVQLQINYADWEDGGVASRKNYETARRHGKSVVVMEPVKGGRLASPPEEVEKLMKDYAPDASPASWAIRFSASLDGVITVLSGMSNMGQMRDNISYMQNFKPLCDDERRVINKAQAILGNSILVPCTSCRYCVSGCPQKIAIPEVFSAYNRRLGGGSAADAEKEYLSAVSGGGTAKSCVSCRRCEKVCPQHIKISEHLKKCAEAFD